MITSALLSLIYFFIKALLLPIPTASALPDRVEEAILFILDTIASWQSVIPIFDTMLSVLIIILSIEAVIYTFLGVNWIINKVRGSG